MAVESSCFPFPSEIVVPPAAYLASQGKMDLEFIIIWGTVGSLAGAWFNYILGYKLGRPFLVRYGRYLMISEKSLKRAEEFFEKYGGISTFIGRLIPVVRQYISLPAGVAKMKALPFTVYTLLGAGVWVFVLALIGYYAGDNKELILKYSNEFGMGAAIGGVLLIIFYLKKRRAF
ncbi:MAG: DedA family protein [Synergistetes bacterium]|nr:DedA family protein [Synergistota bacterium]MDW8191411.1 DedA family protein [Synergistota bacterium]